RLGQGPHVPPRVPDGGLPFTVRIGDRLANAGSAVIERPRVELVGRGHPQHRGHLRRSWPHREAATTRALSPNVIWTRCSPIASRFSKPSTRTSQSAASVGEEYPSTGTTQLEGIDLFLGSSAWDTARR